jgi:hypothetical protein
LRRDPAFRAHMDYCGPAGVPLGFFLGGPFRFDDFSRDAAIAWHYDREARCPTCGEYDDEWRDEKGLKLEGRKAPKVVSQHICPGCEAIELAHNADEKAERRPGAKTILLARDVAARMKAAAATSPKGRRRKATVDA